jgi:phospholipase/lecithinase/hemolysin
MKGNAIRLCAPVASCLLVLLAACGGAGHDGPGGDPSGDQGGVKFQIVSFGDSLSDVGTFTPIAELANGGRFTTNPGQVWSQDVANHYGDTLTAAFTISLTETLTEQGGLGYAEGGATVATRQNNFLVDVIGDVEMPVTDQVTSYLTKHHSFNATQLVLVWAGANDVLRAGSLPAAAPTVETAANVLAQTVAEIVRAGATHVVLVNIPNVGATPSGLAASDHGANLDQLSQLFNTTLNAALQTDGLTGKVILIDSYTWMNDLIANYKSNGFLVSNTGQACDPNKTPHDTSLLCSPSTYVTPTADQTYIFADDLHFATRMHLLFAQFVEGQIAATGLGH